MAERADVTDALGRLRQQLVAVAGVSHASVVRNRYTRSWRIRARFHGITPLTQEWVLTDHELAMDRQALPDMMRRILEDCRRLTLTLNDIHLRAHPEDGAAAAAWGEAVGGAVAGAEAEAFAANARAAMQQTECHFRDLLRGLDTPYWARHYGNSNSRGHRKARELFIKTAGMEAYAVLNNGCLLDITGSAGTAYAMIKSASFCIRNRKTGIEYCAVVPGVPIWDHLLGIKLMVEHDEPRFLATANSSIGRETILNRLRQLHVNL